VLFLEVQHSALFGSASSSSPVDPPGLFFFEMYGSFALGTGLFCSGIQGSFARYRVLLRNSSILCLVDPPGLFCSEISGILAGNVEL